uniref:Uncharacterized protein n=2 Tax=Pseudomonas TaxID=286 RepID=A0A6B7Q209_9PSED|nr:hypothetical protein [Pseudomonas monteilii]QFX76384.1 hypothetical protein [Pseudomonas monteilii]
MAAHITAPTKCLCGHVDLFSFSSPGMGGRRQDRLYANSTLCGDCSAHIRDLVKPQAKGFYQISLPQLVGHTRAVPWANSLRLGHIRSLGPIMAHLKGRTDPVAVAALAVFEMLFKITDAQYWIGGKEHAFGAGHWVVSEIEHLMRKRDLSMHENSRSAYCYWKAINPAVIHQARQEASALLSSTPVSTGESPAVQPFQAQPPADSTSVFL